MNDKPKSNAPVIIIIAVAAIALLAGCCVLPVGGVLFLGWSRVGPNEPRHGAEQVIEMPDDHGDVSPTPEKKPYGIP